MPESTKTPSHATVSVSETGVTHLQLVGRTESSSFLAGPPNVPGSGPSPYALLSASLGACTAMTLRMYAEHKGWQLSRVQVFVSHYRPSLDARDLFVRSINLEGVLDDEQRARMLEIADACPVSRTLKRGSDIQTVLGPDVAQAGTSPALSEYMQNVQEIWLREA